MSEIPYYFEFPVPKYFREAGWFENENTFKFVTWAFSKCSIEPHKVIMDSNEIILEPFEFIAGRLTSSKECHLTEKKFRGQAERMQKEGLLQKRANSRANRYTIYRWVTARFCKIEGQQKGQQRANSGPTKGHKQELRTIDIKKPPPNPQASDSDGGFFRCLKEDNRLSEADRKKLMKFPEERILSALEYSKHVKPTKTLMHQLIWHCSEPNAPKTQKSFWESFRNHFQNNERYNGATCYLNCETVAFERGMTHRQVVINKPGSQSEMEKILQQFGIAWSYDNH